MTPTTNQNNPRGAGRGLSGRWVLILVVLVFLGPLVAATLYYQLIEDTGPASTANYGQLITPARPLSALPVERLNGEPLDIEFLRGRWTLLQVAPNPCDDACRKSIYDIRQVRLALGREQHRVQRLVVLPEAPEDLQEWRRVHPDLTLTVPQGARLAPVLEALGETGPLEGVRLYVVDPIGNLMMQYAPEAEPKGVLKDMERLLKVSQIG